MNKFIKFRGKIDGQWIYATFGNASPHNRDRDWDRFWSCVDMAVVGQFTGQKDKNDKEIYPGDIIEVHFTWFARPMHEIREVTYDEFGRILPFHQREWTGNGDGLWIQVHASKFEIIGNKYDQPELLEKFGLFG